MTAPDSMMPLPKLTIAQMLAESVEFRHKADAFENVAEMEFAPVQVKMMIQVGSGDGKAFVRLIVSCDEEKAPYEFNVSYVVFYAYEGELPSGFDKRLSTVGATMLYPFARELIASLTGRGRFGATWIAPADFTNIHWADTPDGDPPG